jgi:hypothetical protein
MQQISPPLRIVLVAIALLGAVWFVALRPKPDTSADKPLPAAPGVAGLNKAVAKANGAVATANKAAATEQATGADATDATKVTKTTVTKTPAGTKVTKTTATKVTPVKPVPKKPVVTVNPSASLLAALDRGQVVVLMFRNTSSDSDSVATLVRGIGKRKKVVARVVSIKDVGVYQTFTADTPVEQAPTTLVIGPKRRAKVIVGFTSSGELSQAVADVRRAGKTTS